MLWSRTAARERKAVLSALSAVGETGMTLLALGVAVNMPESTLHLILEALVRSGRVRRRVEGQHRMPGQRTSQYQLRSAQYLLVAGRHSAGMAPAIVVRRPPGMRG